MQTIGEEGNDSDDSDDLQVGNVGTHTTPQRTPRRGTISTGLPSQSKTNIAQMAQDRRNAQKANRSETIKNVVRGASVFTPSTGGVSASSDQPGGFPRLGRATVYRESGLHLTYPGAGADEDDHDHDALAEEEMETGSPPGSREYQTPREFQLSRKAQDVVQHNTPSSRKSLFDMDDLIAQTDMDAFAEQTQQERVAREKCKEDDGVRNSINTYFTEWKDSAEDHVSKENYLKLSVYIALVLTPDAKEKDVIRLAKKDWKRECLQSAFMSQSRFCESMFKLVDLWCGTKEPLYYVDWLEDLREKIKYVSEQKAKQQRLSIKRKAVRRRSTIVVLPSHSFSDTASPPFASPVAHENTKHRVQRSKSLHEPPSPSLEALQPAPPPAEPAEPTTPVTPKPSPVPKPSPPLKRRSTLKMSGNSMRKIVAASPGHYSREESGPDSSPYVPKTPNTYGLESPKHVGPLRPPPGKAEGMPQPPKYKLLRTPKPKKAKAGSTFRSPSSGRNVGFASDAYVKRSESGDKSIPSLYGGAALLRGSQFSQSGGKPDQDRRTIALVEKFQQLKTVNGIAMALKQAGEAGEEPPPGGSQTDRTDYVSKSLSTAPASPDTRGSEHQSIPGVADIRLMLGQSGRKIAGKFMLGNYTTATKHAAAAWVGMGVDPAGVEAGLYFSDLPGFDPRYSEVASPPSPSETAGSGDMRGLHQMKMQNRLSDSRVSSQHLKRMVQGGQSPGRAAGGEESPRGGAAEEGAGYGADDERGWRDEGTDYPSDSLPASPRSQALFPPIITPHNTSWHMAPDEISPVAFPIIQGGELPSWAHNRYMLGKQRRHSGRRTAAATKRVEDKMYDLCRLKAQIPYRPQDIVVHHAAKFGPS